MPVSSVTQVHFRLARRRKYSILPSLRKGKASVETDVHGIKQMGGGGVLGKSFTQKP